MAPTWRSNLQTGTVATWLYEGRPDGDAVETMDLQEARGVTTMTIKMTFRDKVGRPTKFEGMQDAYDRVEDLLISLLDRRGCLLASRGSVPGT